ncbi:MAG: GGDEF domain-containing protein [Candidatus Tyrphobacter sp.]
MEAFFTRLVAAARRKSGDVLQVLFESARACEPAIDAALFFEPLADAFACIHCSGARAEYFSVLRLQRRGAGLVVAAALAGSPLTLKAPADRVMPGDRGAIAIPFVADGDVTGIWYASSAASPHLAANERIVALASCACEAYALALERERDRSAATFDSLTGVLTPRAFRSFLVDVVGSARDAVLSLWFVDTDNFKQVNDECGHEAGDLVLQRMAALLRAHAVAERDLVGRKGGDEFCMLVRGVRKMQAVERARDFCDAVRATDFGHSVRTTASVGVAALPFDASDAASLLEAADAAMYHAKRAGRDRVAYAAGGAGFALYE